MILVVDIKIFVAANKGLSASSSCADEKWGERAAPSILEAPVSIRIGLSWNGRSLAATVCLIQ